MLHSITNETEKLMTVSRTHTPIQKKKIRMIIKWHKTSYCSITDQINDDESSYVNNIHNVNWVSIRISHQQEINPYKLLTLCVVL